jgi:hypothetical protein
MPRLPFIEAVNEPRCLKGRFDQLSKAQQMVLLAAYGCPLDNKDRDDRGWTQLDYWWTSQGHAQYDSNGFIKRVTPPPGAVYSPHEYKETWVAAGIRGGKGEVASFASVYEAVFGGHEDFFREGQPAYVLQIAQDLTKAKTELFRIRTLLDDIPFLTTPYHGPWSGKLGERIGRQTVDIIQLWNGMHIKTAPPTVKAVRGYDAAVGVLDEIGVWPMAEDAANTDEEVYTQVKSRFAQFPYSKLLALSSPWIMSGMLYRNHKIGTRGSKVFCVKCQKRKPEPGCPKCQLARRAYKNFLGIHLTTAAFGGIDGVNKQARNKLGDFSLAYQNAALEYLEEYRLLNPEEFRRECLAEFLPAVGSFLNAKILDECVDKGEFERPPIVIRAGKPTPPYIPMYVAAIDPAFRHDAFAFGIAHTDEHGKVIIDVIREWLPPAELDKALKPTEILAEITPLMDAYDVVSAASDQHEFASLEELALDEGWCMERINFGATSKNNIMGNLKTLVNQRQIRLLDNEDALMQLKSLQKRNTEAGTVTISAPVGQLDDLAVIHALLAKCAISLAPDKAPAERREPTTEELCQQTIDRKHRLLQESYE